MPFKPLIEKASVRKSYRGDTLRLSQDGQYLFVTTRGMTTDTRGYLAVWRVAPDGTLGSSSCGTSEDPHAPLDRYETPTSGGKANAIETFPFHLEGSEGRNDWIVLTDDIDGWVWVLEWDGKKIEEVAGVRLEAEGTGASHAVWLS